MLEKGLTDEQIAGLLDNFSLFHMAYSWDRLGSLILVDQPEGLNSIRPARGVDFSGTLVGVHIGLEDTDSLIVDPGAGFTHIA